MFDTLLQDIKYGLRILLKRPGFTAVAVVTLALSIGASTAVFSLVNAVLLRQLPYKNPDHLVWIWMKRVDRDKAPISLPDFVDLQSRNTTLDHMSGFTGWAANLTGAGAAERLEGARVSGDMFQTLDVAAVHGRALEPEDDNPQNSRVVVLSYGLWMRRFGGDESLIEKPLTLNGNSYTIKGVLPPSFVLPGTKAEIYIPLSPATDPWRTERGTNSLRVLARLKPAVTAQQAQADLDGIVTQLRQDYPTTNGGKIGASAILLYTEIVADYSLAIWLLFLAVVSVLLIGCSNLANLLTVEATGRFKEIAIRMAMGGERRRLVRQLLTENLMIGIFGGAAGFLLTFWSLDLLKSLAPSDLPRLNEISIDGRAFLFTVALSLIAGIVFGLAPAIQTSKVNLVGGLSAESRGSSEGSRRKLLRDLLVVFEVSASLVLLIGAGLFVRSFMKFQSISPGFNADNVLTVQLPMPRNRFSKHDPVATFCNQISDRLKQEPGVESVSFNSILPLTGLFSRCNFLITGRPPARPEDTPVAQYRCVGLDYFQTMGIPLIAGREFTAFDGNHTQQMVIINQTAADRLFPNGNAVGESVDVFDLGQTPRTVQIVGVVGNVRQINLNDEPSLDLYTSLFQVPDDALIWVMGGGLNLVVKTSYNPLMVEPAVRRTVQSVESDVPVTKVRSLSQVVSSSSALSTKRFYSNLWSVFAGAALILAMLGIYGVVSQSVTQRTREIGIRMALGAQRGEIFRMVVLHTLRLVSIGVVAGLVGSYFLYRLLSTLLFRIGGADPSTFVISAVMLMLVAVIASARPARRATKVDPIIALYSS